MSVPLCVDLDGTLIRTDSLFEGLIRLMRHHPLLFLKAVGLFLRKGRPLFKQFIAQHCQYKDMQIPVNPELLEFIQEQKQSGRTIILVTAADKSLGEQFVALYPYFDEVMGSDGVINLKSHRKAEALVQRFGDKGFDYCGNSHADLPVWEKSREIIVVNPSPGISKKAKTIQADHRAFDPHISLWKTLPKILGPRDCAINFLVFAPFLLVRIINFNPSFSHIVITFIILCLITMSSNIISVLLDIDKLRLQQKDHPLIRGDINVSLGLNIAGIGLLFALLGALCLSGLLLFLLLVFYALFLYEKLSPPQTAKGQTGLKYLLYTMRLLVGMAV